MPLAVLVNGASASAAELVAGALQDHGRALKVVRHPHLRQRGSIQMVLPLATDSAIKLTVARYFTPNGREIQNVGITPDVVVAAPANSLAENGMVLRESDLANHLAPVANAAAAPDEETVASTAQRAPIENANTFGTPQDRTLQAAVAALAPQPRAATGLAAALRRTRALIKVMAPSRQGY